MCLKILISLLTLFLSVVARAEPTVYSWFSGDTEEKVYVSPQWVGKLAPNSRVELVRVTDARAQAELRRGRLPRQFAHHTLVFTRRRTGGDRMALPGNFFVIFDPALTPADAETIIETQGWVVVEKLKLPGPAYVLRSPPGLKSLELANHARKAPKVVSAEPIWWKEVAKK